MERQHQDTLYQGELDLRASDGEVRLPGADRGGSPRKARVREQQAFEAWREELGWKEGLMESVAHPYNLRTACQRVMSNKGAPGIDGMTVEEQGEWLGTHMAELRENLLNGSYRPPAVKGVSIPKPNGGTRLLGIPTVIARLVPRMRGWANYFKLAAIKRLCQELDEWIRRRLRCLRLKQCKHPRGIRRFLESIGAKRKLWLAVVAMGTSWWRNACSQPANICMDNAWLRAEGYIPLQKLLGT